MKRYRVEVVQTNVFFEEAESETEARRIAAEDRIWDEDQRAPDYYGVHFNIEEVTSSEPSEDWQDIEGQSGCYCVICHQGVKEDYYEKSGGVCGGGCKWDDPVLGQ